MSVRPSQRIRRLPALGLPAINRPAMNLPARAIAAGIRLYRAFPRWRVASCRFEPTCSQYALDALSTWGAVRGTWLGVRRVGRCNPWGGWGYDPVPSRLSRGTPLRDAQLVASVPTVEGSSDVCRDEEHSCSM